MKQSLTIVVVCITLRRSCLVLCCLSHGQLQPVVQQGGRDHDYARKQWSGLLGDVYIPRAELYRQQAMLDAAAGRPFDADAAKRSYARLAFEWQTNFSRPGSEYPTEPVGDPITTSVSLHKKWSKFFHVCS